MYERSSKFKGHLDMNLMTKFVVIFM